MLLLVITDVEKAVTVGFSLVLASATLLSHCKADFFTEAPVEWEKSKADELIGGMLSEREDCIEKTVLRLLQASTKICTPSTHVTQQTMVFGASLK